MDQQIKMMSLTSSACKHEEENWIEEAECHHEDVLMKHGRDKKHHRHWPSPVFGPHQLEIRKKKSDQNADKLIKHKENTVQATSPHPYSLFQQKHKKIRPFPNSSTIFHFSAERLMFKLVTVYITIVRNAETMLCVVRNRLANRLEYAKYVTRKLK